jgi:3-oxoacyl-[acyl-carrier-protein] synthase II
VCQVVITGAGVVSSIGATLAEFKQRMFASESGTINIRGKLVAPNFPVSVAAPVLQGLKPPDILSDYKPARIPHVLQLAGTATQEAIQYLPEELPVDAVVYGGQEATESSADGVADPCEEGPEWQGPLHLIRRILEDRGHGPIDERDLVSINNVTVSSNQAIGMAFHRIRSGLWQRAVVSAVYGRCGAKDLMNFHLLGTLNTDDGPAAGASRPFSKTRSGFVLGEGAATLVLEARTVAEKRGAKILGAVTGYATTSDAYRITDGRSDALGAATAMRKAIRDAGLNSDQIQAISAHGTSTRMNDRLETKAIKQAFGSGAYLVPVISLKSQIGHCLAAAGALEAVASLLMLSEQKLAPTINYNDADAECDLDYVPNVARPATLQRILSNNFGFGGQNTCVVFEDANACRDGRKNSNENFPARPSRYVS